LEAPAAAHLTPRHAPCQVDLSNLSSPAKRATNLQAGNLLPLPAHRFVALPFCRRLSRFNQTSAYCFPKHFVPPLYDFLKEEARTRFSVSLTRFHPTENPAIFPFAAVQHSRSRTTAPAPAAASFPSSFHCGSAASSSAILLHRFFLLVASFSGRFSTSERNTLAQFASPFIALFISDPVSLRALSRTVRQAASRSTLAPFVLHVEQFPLHLKHDVFLIASFLRTPLAPACFSCLFSAIVPPILAHRSTVLHYPAERRQLDSTLESLP